MERWMMVARIVEQRSRGWRTFRGEREGLFVRRVLYMVMSMWNVLTNFLPRFLFAHLQHFFHFTSIHQKERLRNVLFRDKMGKTWHKLGLSVIHHKKWKAPRGLDIWIKFLFIQPIWATDQKNSGQSGLDCKLQLTDPQGKRKITFLCSNGQRSKRPRGDHDLIWWHVSVKSQRWGWQQLFLRRNDIGRFPWPWFQGNGSYKKRRCFVQPDSTLEEAAPPCDTFMKQLLNWRDTMTCPRPTTQIITSYITIPPPQLLQPTPVSNTITQHK